MAAADTHSCWFLLGGFRTRDTLSQGLVVGTPVLALHASGERFRAVVLKDHGNGSVDIQVSGFAHWPTPPIAMSNGERF